MNITTLKPIVRAGDLFKSLQPEEEQRIERTVEVKKDSILERIIEGLEESFKIKVLDRFYEKIHGFAYKGATERDINRLLILLNSYDEDDQINSGEYISALINYSANRTIRLNTKLVGHGISDLGIYNDGKNIIIEGDAGINLGHDMKRGRIYVNGNADICVGGSMSGGKIYIRGDAGSSGCTLGSDMHGGEIHFYGNIQGTIGLHATGGNIYHKGKPIMLNGRRIEK